MKPFYSIICTPLKVVSQEQVAIALLLSDGTNTFFHFSSKKLSYIKDLFSNQAYQLLKSYLDGLESNFLSDADKSESILKFSDAKYLSYLADYNNNLVTYSKPVSIDLECNAENFKRLFEKFVFQYESQKEELKISYSNKVKSALQSQIKENLNWNKKLTSREIPHLLIPTQVDFIGKNAKPVAGQSIDFEKGTSDLSNKIGKFISLIKTFELGEIKGQYYLIGEEPNKMNFPAQHEIWHQLNTSKLMDFVPLNEMEQIIDYVKKHNVEPFIQ